MESRLLVQAPEPDEPHHLPQQDRSLGTQDHERRDGEQVSALIWGSPQ